MNGYVGKRVAIVGAGPGGVSAAIAFRKANYEVRLYEQNPEPKPLGGAVLLSVPVLAVLRYYGIDVVNNFGLKTRVQFRNPKGEVRVDLPFNKSVEKAMGIEGWHYGILRSSAYAKMVDALNVLDPDVITPDHRFVAYEERGNEIVVKFDNGNEIAVDLLVGADGIRSRVSQQALGSLDLFHVGLRVWLAWCEDIAELPKDIGALHHGRNVQASYFPMKHEGKPGFEWWIVERSSEVAAAPADSERHIRALLAPFAYPMNLFADRTDFSKQIFRWEVYNRPSLMKWSKGRVVCLGDAVHPVSPYAAYGMGMAIEDGYFLARAIGTSDLSDGLTVQRSIATFEAERVAYCNHQVEFARKLGNIFHKAPAPLAWLRDQVFDRTGLLQSMVERDYLADAERMSMSLKEFHV
ncbi:MULTISPECIES: FAD-dependent oxidoreductase [Burkholderia]|uniref:FAD-dependent oxidoreductase n=1 Tax=Burkholderia TaxID=32008 RepID=UPI00158BA2CB|nr:MULTISPECIES: NAD(P)/FAD-dependent oxidoreductase [Burkholderia]MDF3100083.1 FAD-dependent monooxygenase [Burkholderia semiarida]MDF3104534.1 FAD-dependent monooxygenase [Burkholderia semiarida]MDN7485582.1 NAD(P)/FAD-dependent oxidoreductase [Burkholderia orbicola]